MKIFKASNRLNVILSFTILLTLVSCNMFPENKATETLPITSTSPQPTYTITSPPEPTKPVVEGTITIWHSWDENQMPALVSMIDRFKELYPNVFFDVLYFPNDILLEKYISAANAGIGPSILLGDSDWGHQLAEANLIASLSDQPIESVVGVINQPALKNVEYYDQIIGIPYSINGVILFRNKDIIQQPPDSFEGLISEANQATAGEQIGAYLDRSFFYGGGHLESIGGKLMDENSLPTFNDEKGVEWVNLLLSFDQAGPTDLLTDTDIELFRNGKVGWIIEGSWSLQELYELLGPEILDVDIWPSYNSGSLGGYVRSENAYMNARLTGNQKYTAWKFIEHMVSPISQTIIAEVWKIPASTSVDISALTNGKIIAKVMKSMEIGTPFPPSLLFEIYSSILDSELKQIYNGTVSPKDGLQSATEKIRTELSKTLLSPTTTP